MTRIRVHRPTLPQAETGTTTLAPRGALPDQAHLTIIDNGKPKGRDLMERIAKELRGLLPIASVDVHSKPSAGAPITEDVATMLAVRSHMIISGLGD